MSRTYNSGEEAVGATDRPQSFWDEAIANVGFTREQVRCKGREVMFFSTLLDGHDTAAVALWLVPLNLQFVTGG